MKMLNSRIKAGICRSRFLSTKKLHGLLSGVSDISSTLYYSDKIITSSAASLVRDQTRLYNICLNNEGGDVSKAHETLQSNVLSGKAFLESDKVCNRKQFVSLLDDIVTQRGIFACVLSGKSTGKTIVLNDLQKRHPVSKVFCVDLRTCGSNILEGLVDVLQQKLSCQDPNIISDNERNILSQIVIDCVEKVMGVDVESSSVYIQQYPDILGTMKDEHRMLKVLVTELIAKLGNITLIIDEANLALAIHDDTSAEDIKHTKNTLAFFTSLTKVYKKLNVILVSSEYSFPFNLQYPKLSFCPSTFNQYIYSGEVAPNDMYELLTKSWNVAPNLAIALIEYYGGHIYDIYHALRRLHLRKDEFALFDSVSFNNVRRCLRWRGEGTKDQQRMKYVLTQLCKTGICDIDGFDDPVADVISKNHVGGVIQKIGHVIGLSPTLNYSKFALIPATQSMRLIIADELSVSK